MRRRPWVGRAGPGGMCGRAGGYERCVTWSMRSDMIVHSAEPLNAEPPSAALAERELTDADTFYVRNHGPVPDIDLEAWRLRVGGLVSRPLELSLADLQRDFDQHDVVAAVQCAGNRPRELVQVPGISRP